MSYPINGSPAARVASLFFGFGSPAPARLACNSCGNTAAIRAVEPALHSAGWSLVHLGGYGGGAS